MYVVGVAGVITGIVATQYVNPECHIESFWEVVMDSYFSGSGGLLIEQVGGFFGLD